MKSLIRKLVAQLGYLSLARSVFGGLWSYMRMGMASAESRQAILTLHCRTNGKSTDKLVSLLRAMRPPRKPSSATGLMGDLSVEDQRRIVRNIERDGFHVFERPIPKSICDDIEEFARHRPAIVEGRGRDERVLFDPTSPFAKKYYFPENEVVSNPGMQQLMGDPSLLALAEMYLQTHPLLADTTLWWSAVHDGTKDADAGQYFHFDFDPPPRWLMVFVYLTDVGPDNGPHVYVRGSHLSNLPQNSALRRRGYVRISDADVISEFGAGEICELHGKRGTVLVVDTAGFHRGMPLVAGHRLMAQLIYGFPHFAGAQSVKEKIETSRHPALAAAFAGTPRVYQKYL